MRPNYVFELRYHNKGWAWRLRSGNGRTLADSPFFKTKFHCKKTALTLRSQLAQASGVEVRYEEHA